jgi:hypothetical protein
VSAEHKAHVSCGTSLCFLRHRGYNRSNKVGDPAAQAIGSVLFSYILELETFDIF